MEVHLLFTGESLMIAAKVPDELDNAEGIAMLLMEAVASLATDGNAGRVVPPTAPEPPTVRNTVPFGFTGPAPSAN